MQPGQVQGRKLSKQALMASFLARSSCSLVVDVIILSASVDGHFRHLAYPMSA